MSGVMARVSEEVAEGAERIARRVVVGGMLAVAASSALTANVSAQQMALGGPPTVETAGRIAGEICAKRGDNSADCVRNERNALVSQIGAQANATEDCAKIGQELARDPVMREKGGRLLQGKAPSQYPGGICKFVKDLSQS